MQGSGQASRLNFGSEASMADSEAAGPVSGSARVNGTVSSTVTVTGIVISASLAVPVTRLSTTEQADLASPGSLS